VWSFGASQAKDVEKEARAQNWSESSIQHLLGIVSDAQSGKWASIDAFGQHVYADCIATWHQETTPADRQREADTIAAKRRQDSDRAEKIQADVQRTSLCQKYQGIAMEMYALKNSVPYKEAADKALAMAYGPNGEVYRDSEANADILMELAAAAYFSGTKYGKTSVEFMHSAFSGCMAGHFLDASDH
jgi:hypothetical protein